MSPSYDYYRIFYYVACYRSFTRAAAALMNSQPNITRSMNNLENELGCKLFFRSNRGVMLTPEGEQLFSHIKIAQEQIMEAEAELDSRKNLTRGMISIGASETALNIFLLDKLRAFHQRFPDIRLRISNHSTPQALAALEQGTVDLAVVTTPTRCEKHMKQTVLMPFREILIGGSGFQVLAGQRHHLAELKPFPLIMLSKDTMTHRFYHEFFLSNGMMLEPDTEVATVDQILPLVRYDLGLGFVPDAMACDALHRGEVFEIPLTEPIPQRSVVLVQDLRKPLSVAAHAFVEMLK
ncbi:MAG: LysR family transcriptional regulator [Oscillospiraceae bacterium]|nr:LysR family transcriptional regulator [Oscillospiraceae bacterium]